MFLLFCSKVEEHIMESRGLMAQAWYRRILRNFQYQTESDSIDYEKRNLTERFFYR